jgi:hypothetical protein
VLVICPVIEDVPLKRGPETKGDALSLEHRAELVAVDIAGNRTEGAEQAECGVEIRLGDAIWALCAAARSAARMSGRRRTRSAGIPATTSRGGTGIWVDRPSRPSSGSGAMPSSTRNAFNPCFN